MEEGFECVACSLGEALNSGAKGKRRGKITAGGVGGLSCVCVLGVAEMRLEKWEKDKERERVDKKWMDIEIEQIRKCTCAQHIHHPVRC